VNRENVKRVDGVAAEPHGILTRACGNPNTSILSPFAHSDDRTSHQQSRAGSVEALPYIQRFHDKVIVVKVGGSIMDDEQALSTSSPTSSS
jgi:hypothetical protein